MHRATELFVNVLLVLVAAAGRSLAIDKHWLPDLEWQTEKNWIDGRLPDADSSVMFPEKTWHTVGLPDSGNLEVSKIYMPVYGSLALGKNGVLAFNELRSPEKYVRWAKKGLYLWIDPDNWDGYTEATPHVDRLPCRDDVVVLPSKNRTLNMVLPNVHVEVTAVRINDETDELVSWRWRQLADQSREFTSNRLTVTYASQLHQCVNCPCQADNSLADEVCSYIWQAEKCAPPRCEYPLKVEGHCCDFCGGRLTLKAMASKGNKVSAEVVKPRANKALENWRGYIQWHVRNTWEGEVEVLIAEEGEYSGINSQEAIDMLAKALIADGYEISVNEATGSPLDGSELRTILGPLLGIPVILILLLLVAFPYYGYTYSQVFTACVSVRGNAPSKRKKSSAGTFGFARFKNLPGGDVHLAENTATEDSEPTEDDSDVDGPSSGSKRFENPLYLSMRDKEKSKSSDDEQIIDVDAPISLAVLQSKVQEDAIEELSLE